MTRNSTEIAHRPPRLAASSTWTRADRWRSTIAPVTRRLADRASGRVSVEGFTRRLSAAKAEAPDPRRATALPPWAAADSASVAADSAAAAAWPSVTRSSCMAPLMRTAPVCLARARWASIRSSRARFRASSNARSAAFTSVAVVVMFSSTRETGDLNPLGKMCEGDKPCAPVHPHAFGSPRVPSTSSTRWLGP